LILHQLHASEINFTIESLYDAGWKVTLGDALNGIDAEERFHPDELEQVAGWLIAVASARYPRSGFARIYATAPAND
jgi:hypothetical protein